MLTLRRFETLIDSYGADPRRWPEQVRADAQMLLSVSPEARSHLEEARMLDDVIEAASSREDGLRWRDDEANRALVRLRAAVAARIASPTAPVAARRGFGWWLAGAGPQAISPRLRWIGLATGGAVAIVAGLMVGAMYPSAPASASVLASLLQPAAIGILAD